MHSHIRPAAVLAASLALALGGPLACGRGDRGAADPATSALATDSALARDLALAAGPATGPTTFADTAVGTSAPVTAAPTHRTTTAAPTPKRTPERSTPRPTSRPKPTPTPAPAPVATEPTPAPAPVHRAAGIAAGTGLDVSTGSRVCTSALPGDKIVATLASDVTGTDGAVLRAGSKVVLEVASVNKGDGGATPSITFRVRAIDTGDRSLPAVATGSVEGGFEHVALETNKSSDAKKVAAGAVIGAILGQVIGKDTKGTVIGAAAGAAAGTAVAVKTGGPRSDSCLPAGANVRLVLQEPVTM